MIVAEIGQNWCGDFELALKLIDLAQENGADLVKFQLYDHDKLYKDEPEVLDVALTKKQAFELFNYGEKVGIEVFFSVFDIERIRWCEEMGAKRYKIARGFNQDGPLVQAVKDTKKPYFISSLNYKNVMPMPLWGQILYCISEYPTLINGLSFSKVVFDEITQYDGFSDHTIGLDAAKIALARGARVIEKHFAIDHRTGEDAEWSMTPSELRELKRFELVVNEAL